MAVRRLVWWSVTFWQTKGVRGAAQGGGRDQKEPSWKQNSRRHSVLFIADGGVWTWCWRPTRDLSSRRRQHCRCFCRRELRRQKSLPGHSTCIYYSYYYRLLLQNAILVIGLIITFIMASELDEATDLSLCHFVVK